MQCNVTALFPSLPKSPCRLGGHIFTGLTVVARTRVRQQIPSGQPLCSKLRQDYSDQSAPDLGSVPTLFIQLSNVCDAGCDCVALEAIPTQSGCFT